MIAGVLIADARRLVGEARACLAQWRCQVERRRQACCRKVVNENANSARAGGDSELLFCGSGIVDACARKKVVMIGRSLPTVVEPNSILGLWPLDLGRGHLEL
jgi:hypothetical protein